MFKKVSRLLIIYTSSVCLLAFEGSRCSRGGECLVAGLARVLNTVLASFLSIYSLPV